MRLLFNPSGVHIQKGKLMLRVDLYPENGDESAPSHYVEVPDTPIVDIPTSIEDNTPDWHGRVPSHFEMTPILCHFFCVPESFVKADVLAYVVKTFDPNTIATLDHLLALPGVVGRRLSPYMRRKKPYSQALVQAADTVDLVASSRFKAAALGGRLLGGGTIEHIAPGTIDIGAGAIYRPNAGSSGYTALDTNNPANAAGSLDTLEVYFYEATTSLEMATFYGTSPTFSTRDYETLGSAAAGSKVTFTGLACSVETGDYLGQYYSDGRIHDDTSSGSVWYMSGDYIPVTNGTFTAYTAVYSTYGTGAESGGYAYSRAMVIG